MYLEISPRQSGKTERLLRTLQIYSNSHPKDLSYVFVAKASMLVNLRQQLAKLGGTQHDNVKFKIANELALHSQSFEYEKLFFDEFDYIDEKFWHLLFHCFRNDDLTLSNSYFTTTPKRIRRILDLVNPNSADIMAILLQKAGFKWASYDTLSTTPKEELEKMLPVDAYILEIEGMFIK